MSDAGLLTLRDACRVAGMCDSDGTVRRRHVVRLARRLRAAERRLGRPFMWGGSHGGGGMRWTTSGALAELRLAPQAPPSEHISDLAESAGDLAARVDSLEDKLSAVLELLWQLEARFNVWERRGKN